MFAQSTVKAGVRWSDINVRVHVDHGKLWAL